MYVLVHLLACGALQDTTFATGSGTMVASPDRGALYAVNVDEGTVSRVDATTSAVTTLSIGAEPTRIARAGDRVYVTLRATRQMAVLTETDSGLTLDRLVDVGAEPYGVVAREDGTRVYVAMSEGEEVWELDGSSFTTLRRFAVSGHPSWLALHPSGKALYVASAIGGVLSWIDLDDAAGTVRTVELPALLGAGEDSDRAFTARLTGDPAVSPTGTELGVPGLWVDNVKDVAAPDDGLDTSGGGYGSVGLGLSRINPGIVSVPLGADGTPESDGIRAAFLAGFAPSSRGSDETVAMRSYLAGLRYNPAGDMIYATMEASHTVVAVSPDFLSSTTMCDVCGDSGGGLSVAASGFWSAPAVFVSTEEGPRGVAFLGDEVYVHNFIDRTVAALGKADVEGRVQQQFEDGFTRDVSVSAKAGTRIEESALGDMAEAGRRLFYSATDSNMAGEGAGVSCSTCHLDGRNDGLTWPLPGGPRQTINLAGVQPGTAPFTWTDDVASVGTEAGLTSGGRMGGDGLSDAQATAIETFLTGTRAVDHADKGATSDAITRGKVIFERADVGCATCHAGPLLVDNLPHDLYGLTGVDTPTLNGIAATAPYLHDGSAATLRDVLIGATAAGMGDTSMLSSSEMDDLEAYLRSL